MFGLVVILHSLPVVATGVPTYIAHECALAGPGEIITWRENKLETTPSKLLFPAAVHTSWVSNISRIVLIVGAMFVCSQGVSGSAVLGTYHASVPWCFHVGRLDVLENIGLHFGLSPTVATLPISTSCFLHLRSDEFIHI